ncbi:carboxypeptidase-like regulatory domain-containing protein, partial [Arthrospira platensis SPKY1]|nr:carboxypeptidase-like regulatory domain-containing protein [Arthrospira platensis SPKY1]
ADKILEFRNLTESFGNKLENTGIRLESRRSKRYQIDQILKACNLTLRTQIDPFVRFHQKEHPLFHDDYKLVRGFPRKKKRKYIQHDQVEIVGTVSDAVTGLPIQQAIINLVGFEISVETDSDGYYLIDELPATKFYLSCYKQGYN